MVVLAAGGSTRLGTPKQLLPFRGTTLLRHAALVALEAARAPRGDARVAGRGTAAAGPVAVVLGGDASRMRAELAGLDVQPVVNPRWQDGLSTSIDAALAALEATAGVDAVLFTACDQPGVGAAEIRAVIGAYAAGRPPVVACAYAGTLGVPALFDRRLFPELRALRGDAGAKAVIERHRTAVAAVPCPGAALDVDTAEDARRLAGDDREA